MVGHTNLELKLHKKCPLKSSYYKNRYTRKVKDRQKLSSKEIYFILKPNSTKYNKSLKFIS